MNNNQPFGLETKNYIKPKTPKKQNPVLMLSLGALIGIAVMAVISFFILPKLGLPFSNAETEHIHELSGWRTVSEATCGAEGEEIGYCTCGYSSVRAIPKLPHSYGEWSVTSPATCSKEGEEARVCACGA
jgi:hypothetical protein